MKYRKHQNKPQLNGGFTLMELLVVIAIITILATIIFAAFNGARESARIAQAQHDVQTLEVAITLLALDTGFWPGREAAVGTPSPQPEGVVQCWGANNEVRDLNDSQAGVIVYHPAYTPAWRGPYMKIVPIDPWGNNYFFDTDYRLGGGREAVVIGSYGPNGVGNNVYDSDNIIRILAETLCS